MPSRRCVADSRGVRSKRLSPAISRNLIAYLRLFGLRSLLSISYRVHFEFQELFAKHANQRGTSWKRWGHNFTVNAVILFETFLPVHVASYADELRETAAQRFEHAL